jgi:hypothetical protein
MDRKRGAMGSSVRWVVAVASAISLAWLAAGCTTEPDAPEAEQAAALTVPAPQRALAGTALFVVADASAVGAGDVAVRQRLQGLGLTVVTKSDGQVRASDATGAALVVISSSVDSNLLGTMFRDTPVPLVTWEHALYDSLGLAAPSGALADQTGVDVVHGAHPTAAGRRNAVAVLSAAGGLRWGTPGAGAAIVAYARGSTSRAAQFVYETGARLVTGAAAPARRVGTFLDHGSSQNLTADGWALFDASVVWAAASGRAVPAVPPVCALSGQALFVVADATAIGAGDADVQRRLESLGLRVTVKSDGKVKATDAGGMQLIVISSSVDSTLLGAMFRDTPVPLVTWEHALYDALAIATSDGGTDADQQTIDLVDSAHALAAGLSGNIKVLGQRGVVRWGKPVPAATIVARSQASPQHAAHFALASGATLANGRPAPARRVGTFLDTDAAHALAPAGWALFDAAVVWAMGGGEARPVAWLVTGDHALEPGDGAVKARLEALGFATRVVRQSTLSQNSLAGVRLVVVTESTQSAEIGDYFAARPIPVVIAEYNLLDDMGMASARGTVAGQREVDIARPQSRLAAGLSGRVRVYSDGMEAAWGTPTAAAEVAATVKSDAAKATVFGYETGATMFGRTAPARRVGLFMFHGNNLTTAGWALFDASVSWAASAPIDNACGDGRDVEQASCTRNFCDSSGCRTVARPDGASCRDSRYCTVDDVCQAGVCGGTPRSCDGNVDACTTATCDEAADTCVTAPRGPDCQLTCDSAPSTREAYRDGWQAGHRRVHRAWRKSDSCDALEAFLDRVSLRLEELMADSDPDAPPTDRRCRVSGKFDGSLAALDEIQLTCDDRCVMRGAVVGKAASAAYCELAIGAAGALHVDEWLRGPINLCGLSHETTCDAVFIDETSTYENAAGTCAPYTRAPFFDVWDRSRERSCDYRNRDP